MVNLFEKLEKTVVIIAAVLAIFPLIQYWSEADDRRLNREATLMVAYMSCLGSGGLTGGGLNQSSTKMQDICGKISSELSQ